MADLKVIIAEDDPQIAEISRRFIERIEGFELVGLANDLIQTQDLIDVYQPDLLLLDIQFPQGTGLELLHDLRGDKNPIDVILITGAREVETIKEAMLHGIFDYIIKPLAFERLEKSLANFKLHIDRLKNLNSMDQADVDALLPRENDQTAKASDSKLPKGIDELTLNRIKEIFVDKSLNFSADEVGKNMGASRITARRYLEYLISINYLNAQIQYGTVGRPERRYQRTH